VIQQHLGLRSNVPDWRVSCRAPHVCGSTLSQPEEAAQGHCL
jgi:hypothetical protein